jgi:hypothetical protein
LSTIDPAEVLGMSDEQSFAEALRAYGARWEQQAERLVGVGEDLLVAGLHEAEEGAGPDPLALRQSLTPRIRPMLEAAAALENLATRGALPAGELPGTADPLAAPDEGGPAWPAAPTLVEVRDRLTAYARSRRLVADDHFGGPLEVRDASVARLTVTRLTQRIAEQRMWTPVEHPGLPEYGDDLAASVGPASGWERTSWTGVRSGSIRPRSCTSCGGDGRARCQQCQGTAFERCEPLEPCALCHGTGRRYARRTALIRSVCDVCNGRGGVPCSFCAGMGRRPCTGCTDGSVGCQRCRGYGQLTEYVEGTVERTPETEVVLVGDGGQLGRGAGDGFRPLLTLTRWRPLPGLPEAVAAAVRAALEERRPGQLRQRVELAVLPAFEVAYTTAAGARRTAWLVGDAHEVRAPGVRWARLPFLAVIGLP